MEAGETGSKALRAAALQALRLLVVAVDDGDALAFFVPGIVSGLSKALLAAGATRAQRQRRIHGAREHLLLLAFVSSC
jgi:hypothetical protein